MGLMDSVKKTIFGSVNNNQAPTLTKQQKEYLKQLRASVDFGNHCSGWITFPLDGNETYMEKKVNYNMVGKQVRFEIRMSNPMIFESMSIGFNAQYKSMKFDD